MGALDSLAGGAANPTTAAALTMLNGAESQSFAKEPPDLQGTATAKDPDGELKVAGHPERFYYPEPHLQEGGGGGCTLGLAYGGQIVPGGFGVSAPPAPAGRFLGPAVNNCASYRPQPPPGPAPASAGPAGTPSYPVSAGELYPSAGDLYPGAHGGEGCYPPAVQHMFPRGPLYPMPGYQVAGKIQVVLNNYPLWAKFHKHQTEMIITKQGRASRMESSVELAGLQPGLRYVDWS
ncbi:UNVERIFIED_CONTAM: hypothetical protein K2H54_020079 [Gekko kuhli]